MWSTKPPFSVDIFKVTTDTDLSSLPRLPRPATKKTTAVTPDGRRIEVDVVAGDGAKEKFTG